MTINTDTVILSVATGAALGFLAVLFYFLSRVNTGKYLWLLLQDTTFVVICAMVTFLVSFPIAHGRIRLLQLMLELPGFLLVWFLLSPAAKKLSDVYIHMRRKLNKFAGKILHIPPKKAKKPRKNSKKPKKILDIHPPGNI